MRTTLYLTVSADGFIARDDHSTPWGGAAWERYAAFCNEYGHFIIGATTYELLTRDPGAKDLELRRIIVVSERKPAFSEAGPVRWVSSPEAAIRLLESEGYKRALVAGGRTLAGSFIERELIDELVLDLQPVLFGTGISMLCGPARFVRLELQRSEDLGAAGIRMTYRIAPYQDVASR